jgi:formiminoglutamase
MNLRIFFDPIDDSLISFSADPFLFINNIQLYKERFPDITKANIAIIGLEEERGTKTNIGTEKGADEIRRKLYKLKKGSSHYKIVDLGNLRCGVTLEESYLRIKEVCEYLIQNNVLPILLGGSQDLDFGQFLAYENTGKMISFLNIDSGIDMQGSSEDMSLHHIHKILVHEPNIIFNYSQLAYQSYLTDTETISVLEKLYFETYRIGQVRESIDDIEPVIRDADMISFDISAIRQTDAPGNVNVQPFGLTGEEACKLCWYAGLNSKLSSIGFYEYNPIEDIKHQTAGVLATMIWYFIEGYYNRSNEFNVNDPSYVKYTVHAEPHQIVFYKHSPTEKWWMEVPYPSSKSNLARNSIVPCSYSDYTAANKGEIPNRWLVTHAKLI